MYLRMATGNNGKEQDILAADIGATKTNMAICHWDGTRLTVVLEETYITKWFVDIYSMIGRFVGGRELPPKIVLAVAGPVLNGHARLTNINWKLSRDELSAHFQKRVLLLNDLEATAYGLAISEQEQVFEIHKGERDNKGNLAIIAPGTGLGEAGLFYNDNGYHPFATEGGHCDFAPRTDLDIELYHYLRRKFKHVSWERLISGPGICRIYDFLLHEKEREEPAWIRDRMLVHNRGAVISDNAKDVAICHETIELFLRYLAAEASNLALKLRATGGIFIAGGIIPHLLPHLFEDPFMKWFSSVGRLQNLAEKIPVSVILNKKAPVIGAAWYGIHQN